MPLLTRPVIPLFLQRHRLPSPGQVMLYAQGSLPLAWAADLVAGTVAAGGVITLEVVFFSWAQSKVRSYCRGSTTAPPHDAAESLRRIRHFGETVGWGEKQWRLFIGDWCQVPRGELPSRPAVREWVAWAFFQSTPQLLSVVDSRAVDDAVRDLELRCGCSFVVSTVGVGPHGTMRPSIDALGQNVVHRPLAVYLLPLALRMYASAAFRVLGFDRREVEGQTFWHSPGTDPSLPPFVLCHGLGVGLAPYMILVRRLKSRFPERGCVVLETPEVSMSLGDEEVSAEAAAVQQIREVLEKVGAPKDDRGEPQGTFIGHSYGSVRVAWVLRRQPALVRSAVLVDPVSCSVFLPEIASGAIYRDVKPRHQFLRREMGTIRVMSRHFWWYRNWQNEDLLPAGRSLLVLGGNDDLLPAGEVRRYMKANCPGVDVQWNDGLGHAQFLWTNGALDRCMDWIEKAT
eukprot:Hpha_TRINITY_DN30323_c0_g1::TRINITY_DN30323_c0_g1_i1::g.146934::m.146934